MGSGNRNSDVARIIAHITHLAELARQAPNVTFLNPEPPGLLLSRETVQKWIGLPRNKLEAIAERHKEMVYQETPGGKRYFRKQKVKQILLGE